MKKLKLSTKRTKQTAHDITKPSAESIQQLIFEDVKNINKINIIIEEFILSLQGGDKKSIDNLSKILVDTFDYFLIKNKTKVSNDLVSFLSEKLDFVLKILCEIIDFEGDEETEGDVEDTLAILVKFIKFYSDKGQINNILESLVSLFVLNSDELVDPKHISAFTTIFKKTKNKDSLLHMIYDIILNKMNEYSNNLSEQVLFNIYNFLISTNKIEDKKAHNGEEILMFKSVFQNVLIKLINQITLPKEILKNLLLNLNKFIFDNLENPLIFSDYLINIYEKSGSDEFDIKVLSLSGLFILITKYKLDYPNYYSVLYKTLTMKSFSNQEYSEISTVVDSKYRNRFFKILELSLKSPTVPIIVIFSFIKKLARICLHSTTSNIAIILGIIQNLIKIHPRTVVLLLRRRVIEVSHSNEKIKEESKFNWEAMKMNEVGKEETDVNMAENNEATNVKEILPEDVNNFSKYEQFRDNEADPYKTRANFSCLWELYTLKSHFSFKIRNLVNKFENNFLKSKEFDMGDIADIKEEDMLYEIGDSATFYTSTLNRNSEEDGACGIFKRIENIIQMSN